MVLITLLKDNNMWNKNGFFILFVILSFYSCNNRDRIVDQRRLSNYDYRQFQGTPAWSLAKAVEDANEEEIISIVRNNPPIINYKSPKYGVTVLHLAVSHHNIKSVECLLNLNADVNIRDTESGDTPLNDACIATHAGKDGIKIIKLLIENGAKINVTELADSSKMPWSPLMSACFDGSIEVVKLLIAKGADVNYVMNDERTALGESIVLEHYKIAYYLLLKGADYTIPIMHIRDYSKKGNGKIVRSVSIKEALEGKRINYLTREREYYYKIVDFLKRKGIIVKESSERT